jgi:hypothetical protein
MKLRLKRLFQIVVLVLSFLAGHQLVLNAQCSGCYVNPGPAGDYEGYFIILGKCPCNLTMDCLFYRCDCQSLHFPHSECGIEANPICFGC